MLAAGLLAQAPNSFSYQAVVRDAAGYAVTDATVGIKISILKGSVAGTPVCVEEFTPTTDELGLVTLAIGSQNTTDFAAIDWSDGPYFVKVELDPQGGTSYTDMGTTQLLSVPYALYARTAEDTDDADPDPENEIQSILINNDSLFLSDGGTVYLGYLLDDADTQKLVLNGFYLGITNGNEVSLPSVWQRWDNDISYDSGKVTINTLNGDIQLHLTDVFGAGGYNLIVGDDAYLTDIDMMNTLGVFGMSDSTTGAIRLGGDGPVLSGSSSGLAVNKDMDMNNRNIGNLAEPVGSQDAATKAYVDALLARIDELEALTEKVKDIDGNLYPAVKIGDQVWMGSNLRTTRYNDEAVITLVSDGTDWSNLGTEAYCWYDNDEASYKNEYGAIYNFYVVESGKLCPSGWHVPTYEEWLSLETYLGGVGAAGGKLKETGTVRWATPNTGATDETGFGGRPGGKRDTGGNFLSEGDYGLWWSSTESGGTNGLGRYLDAASTNLSNFGEDKKTGCSVRCVKD